MTKRSGTSSNFSPTTTSQASFNNSLTIYHIYIFRLNYYIPKPQQMPKISGFVHTKTMILVSKITKPIMIKPLNNNIVKYRCPLY